MITLELPETKRKLWLPEDLSECDSRQYAEACILIWRFQKGEMAYDDFRVEMIYKLLNLKRGSGKFKEAQVEDMYSNIYMLSTYIDSFFEKDEDGKLIIKQYYVHNHSEVIQDAFRKWYGPSDHFENISFGQYIDALNLYSMLEKEKSEKLFYMLMATFYFSRNEKYDPSKVEKRSKYFRHVYFGRVYGFFLLFASFQKYLFSATVFYQGNELDLSILFSSDSEDKSESKIPGVGMLSVAHQIAESGVHGNIREVKETPFWEMILTLYDIRKRDLDNMAQRKKAEEQAKQKNK